MGDWFLVRTNYPDYSRSFLWGFNEHHLFRWYKNEVNGIQKSIGRCAEENRQFCSPHFFSTDVCKTIHPFLIIFVYLWISLFLSCWSKKMWCTFVDIERFILVSEEKKNFFISCLADPILKNGNIEKVTDILWNGNIGIRTKASTQ